VGVRRSDGAWGAPEEVGEIVVRGHTVMLGYWGNDEATREALGSGWLRTGDLGFFAVLDGRPHFFITGRLKEIIIRYGTNISPLAVEAELVGLDTAGPFAVAGFPNDTCGEEIGVYIVGARDPAREASALSVVRRCPVHCRPRVVMFGGEAIPTTVTGKVKRGVLAERFAPYRARAFGSEPIAVDHPGATGTPGA
jgi:long-chain acyl-CoA synthetase